MFAVFKKYKRLLGRNAAEDFNLLAAYLTNFCSDDSLVFHRPDAPSADNPPYIAVNTDRLADYFVTLDTAQTITAKKTFNADVDVVSDAGATIKAVAAQAAIELFPASTATNGGYLDFHYAGSTEDYTARIIELLNKLQIRTGKSIQLLADGTSKDIELSATGVVRAKAPETRIANAAATASVSIIPEEGRIEIFPKSDKTTGGYLDFHYAGSTEDFTSRIIEQSDSLLVSTKNKSLRIASFVTSLSNRSGILLTSDNSVYKHLLENEPARTYSAGEDNQIASRGYCRLNFSRSNHTHGNISNDGKITNAGTGTTADYYVAADGNGNLFRRNKSDLAPDLSGYVTSSALNAALADYATVSTVSNLADVVDDINEAYQDASDVQTAINTALEDYVSSSDLQTELADYVTSTDLQTELADYVTDADLEGYAKSVDGHTPDATGAVSFGLTANKFVKTDASGHLSTTNDNVVTIASNLTGQTTTLNVVTDVVWTGAVLQKKTKQLTLTNGVATSIGNEVTQTIDTPVAYSPS